MIPHRLKILGLPLSEPFFLVKKLGLDVATLAGVGEDMLRDEEDSTVCI